jgi:NADPH:quinone reductase-like Zn-dependent oxidoreductase
MTRKMKAVRIHRFGGPGELVYEDAQCPEPREDELLICVHAAGVNPADCKTRSGIGVASRFKDHLPAILGWDVSGVVEALGSHVSKYSVGDSVYSFARFPDVCGTYAEYVTCPVSQVAPKPHSLNHLQAASMPLVALTAWQALFDAAGLSRGQTVFVHAAAGGVGHIAVQLAKWKGAYVIGTASGRNKQFLREIGVDQFVNYHKTQFEEVVQDVDIVIDPIGGETRERSWSVIKNYGILVALVFGRRISETAAVHNVRGIHILAKPNGWQLNEITKLVDAGYVKPYIDKVFPLKEAYKAHELVEKSHTRGKIVLRVVE